MGISPSFYPLWAKLSPDYIQVTQCEQHIQLRIVLLKPLVTSIFVLENVPHDMEQVFNYSPNAHLKFFKGQCQVFLPAFFHLLVHVRIALAFLVLGQLGAAIRVASISVP